MAIAVGSLVIAADADPFNGSVPAPYGYVSATPGAGTWDVLWSNGAFSGGVASGDITELDQPFKVNDILGRIVRPQSPSDPSRAGIVVIQTASDKLIVESPTGTYAISKSLIEEV